MPISPPRAAVVSLLSAAVAAAAAAAACGASAVALSSSISASLVLHGLGGAGAGGDRIGVAEAFAFPHAPSARYRTSRPTSTTRTGGVTGTSLVGGPSSPLFGGFGDGAAAAAAAVHRRHGKAISVPVDAQHEGVGLRAASASDDAGGNEIDVTIGQPIINGDADVTSTSTSTDDEKEEKEEDGEPPQPLVLEAVPPASHSLETTATGPAGGPVTTLTVHLGAPGHPDPIVLQTGRVGRQAAGAVTLTRGDTVLYATAARDSRPKDNIDFLPLSVDHQERFSSAGLTSGSYNKRDGRVS